MIKKLTKIKKHQKCITQTEPNYNTKIIVLFFYRLYNLDHYNQTVRIALLRSKWKT